MSLLQLHYIPPTLGEPINTRHRTEQELLSELAKVIVSLLVEECDLRVSENGFDLPISLEINVCRNVTQEPVIVKE